MMQLIYQLDEQGHDDEIAEYNLRKAIHCKKQHFFSSKLTECEIKWENVIPSRSKSRSWATIDFYFAIICSLKKLERNFTPNPA